MNTSVQVSRMHLMFTRISADHIPFPAALGFNPLFESMSLELWPHPAKIKPITMTAQPRQDVSGNITSHESVLRILCSVLYRLMRRRECSFYNRAEISQYHSALRCEPNSLPFRVAGFENGFQ